MIHPSTSKPQVGITLHHDGATPLYKQIVEQTGAGIRSGQLPPGTRLPTVRHLAKQLSVTQVTVHRAYKTLQGLGLIDATVGRGTFVQAPKPTIDPLLLLGLNGEPELGSIIEAGQKHLVDRISLAIAEPDPDLYPATEFNRILRSLSRELPSLMGYGAAEGEPSLRFQIASMLEQRGINATPDDVIITSGSTHALALITRTVARPGDCVAVEQPTYFGFLSILRAQGLQPMGVPVGKDGPDLAALERILLRDRPRFFYTMPRHQNPTGYSISPQRRRDLLSLAEKYGLLLVEDDIFHPLTYGDSPCDPLKAADTSEQVAYVDSFSKVLLPGLRIGYMVPPPSLKQQLSRSLQIDTLGSPHLLQRALAEFLRRGLFVEHLKRVIPLYRERRNALLEALEHYMPEGVAWTRPEGGLCCWIELPEKGEFGDLYEACLARGILYTPAEVLMAQPTRRSYLRLTFGTEKPREIRHAVRIIAELIKQRLVRSRPNSRSAQSTKPLV